METSENASNRHNNHDGFFSKLFLRGMRRLFTKCKREELNISDDAYFYNEKISSKKLTNKLLDSWMHQIEKCKEKAGILKPLIYLTKWNLLLSLVLLSFLVLLKLIGAICLYQTLHSLKDNNCFYWATGMAVSSILISLLLQHAALLNKNIAEHAQAALIGLLSKKIFKLKMHLIDVKKIELLIKEESISISKFTRSLPLLIVSLLSLVAGVAVLVNDFRWSCAVFVVYFIISSLLQIVLSRAVQTNRKKKRINCDLRRGMLEEVVENIAQIKMDVHEEQFYENISAVAGTEAGLSQRVALLRSFTLLISTTNPYVSTLLTLVVFEQTGGTVTVASAAFLFSVLFVLRAEFSNNLCKFINTYMDAKHSLSIFKKWLLSEVADKSDDILESPAVTFNNVTVDVNDKSSVIEDLSFSADSSNPLVLIYGEEDTTTLLSTCLQETRLHSGSVNVHGALAYMPRTPWLCEGSVRDNILFGKIYQVQWYTNVLQVCSLTPELDLLKNGDATPAEHLRVVLKQKISLARALYSDADVYILDDPTHMFDTETALYIFERCIVQMLKHKIVIMSTNNLRLISKASEIVFLRKNKSALVGMREQLMEQGVDLMSMIDTPPPPPSDQWENDSAIDTADDLQEDSDQTNTADLWSITLLPKNQEKASTITSVHHEDMMLTNESESQQSKLKTFFAYLFSTGLFLPFVCFFTFAVFLACFLLTDINLADRSSQKPLLFHHTNPIFFVVNAAVVLLVPLACAIFLAWFLARVSFSLDGHMLASILTVPLFYFSTNSKEFVLSIFTDGFKSSSEKLPLLFLNSALLMCELVLTIALICINIPYMALLTLLFAPPCVYFTSHVIPAYIHLSKLNAETLQAHVKTTHHILEGISTIRVFENCRHFRALLHDTNNIRGSALHMRTLSITWLRQRVYFSAMLFSLAAVYAPLLWFKYHPDGNEIYYGILAIGFAHILQFADVVESLAVVFTKIANSMVFIEKMTSLTNQDIEDSVQQASPDVGWPEYGLVTAEAVSYALHTSCPYRVRKMYFCVKPQEKVCIVGEEVRESLVAMLYRLGAILGTVRIDGVCASSINLVHLRQAIAFIPQDPFIYSGNIRDYLRAKADVTDADLWETLEDVHMKGTVIGLSRKLDSVINQGGRDKFTVGQRQLLGLARAIIANSKIVILEEADTGQETNALIVKISEERLNECTFITIARRLSTVMASDRAMVLERGKILEYDEPYELLKKPQGALRHLVDRAGRTEAKHLRIMAEEGARLRRLLIAETNAQFPGCQITQSRSRDELVRHFGKNVVYETHL